MSSSSSSSSFSSFKSYVQALALTPRRLRLRAGSTTTTADEMNRVRTRSGPGMTRSLTWLDLVGFGVGGMVGAGVFVTSGRAARDFAGPAVVVSYAIAGVCALLSAFCYTEFAVDMPVAGGAFSYLRVTFGEFAAFITGANLITDYVLSNAAVARGFTAYLGAAIGVDTSAKWRIAVAGLPEGFNQIDLVAVAAVVAVSICICYSTKESSLLNMILTTLHIIFILFIILMGFWRGDIKNFTQPADPTKSPAGFFPYGTSGVFYGAATVYLSYIGYDAVSTMAEEVKNPTRDIPIGVSGSVVIVTVLYCLMAASMSMLVPYDDIDVDSPFSAAFKASNSWAWATNIIGAGASFGILTSLLVSMLGQARYLCVIARSDMIPSFLAKVNPVTSTPVNASALLGLLTAIIALFTDLEILLNLVSIGTLFVFYMVANAVIYSRYSDRRRHTVAFLLSLSFTATVFVLLCHFARDGAARAVMLVTCALAAGGLVFGFRVFVGEGRRPELWGVPMMPWIPAASVFLNVILLGSMDGGSYARFGFFTVVAVLVYVLYSVHKSFDAAEEEEEGRRGLGGEGGEGKV